MVSHAGYRAPGKHGFHSAKLESVLNQLHLAGTPTHLSRRNGGKIIRIGEYFALAREPKLANEASPEAAFSKRKPKSPDGFQISFPMRSNYMYGRVRRTLPQEIFAFTLCMWIRAGVGPGVGTPFSYSAPGQANELVLIEWGSNPMELLVNDKVRKDTHWLHKCAGASAFLTNPPTTTRL